MIVLKSVFKTYGKTQVLNDVSFRIDPGEFICITGPSGAGKSTLIHLLIGAETVTKGHVEVDGIDLQKVPVPAMQLFRRRVGVVFQDYMLLWNRTARENIAFSLEVCGIPEHAISKRTAELLKQMKLEDRADVMANSLSGGEKARTAIARAIAHRPMILLADEPTGNLDPEQSEEVMKLLQEIHKGGTTVVLATHETALVDALKTRVIRLEDGIITRDSIGGYHKGGKTTDHSPQVTKHHVFVDEEKSPHIPKEKAHHSSIKITPVRSTKDQ